MWCSVRDTTPHDLTWVQVWVENKDESCCPLVPPCQTTACTSLKMTLDRWAPKILYLSVWLFISRTQGSNGQHTSGSHKSSDSTQVCSPVSSRPVKNGVSVIKRSVGFIFSLYRLLHAPRWANRHREMTSGAWQDTPVNVMMPLDVF